MTLGGAHTRRQRLDDARALSPSLTECASCCCLGKVFSLTVFRLPLACVAFVSSHERPNLSWQSVISSPHWLACDITVADEIAMTVGNSA